MESVPALGTAEAIAALKVAQDYRWLRVHQVGFALDLLLGWTSSHTLAMQIIDAVLSSITLILAPVSIVLISFAIRRQLRGGTRLNWVRWLVAIVVFCDEMLTEVANAASQGIRFTQWPLADFLQGPLFSIYGNTINPLQLGNALLLFTLIYAVYRDQVENRHRQLMLEQEFQSARELQQLLIPEDLPEIAGYTLSSAYKPALEVGGDFFQIIPFVSGKGLKAAMAMSMIVGAIRTLVETTTSPADILEGLNRRLYGRMQGGFTTAIALSLDANGYCTLASGGHPSPFLNERELEVPGAFPLGLAPTVTYEETTLQLDTSDYLALYTDGLLEARNSSGELYSFERLQILFASVPTAEQAAHAAVAFGQDDDITVLTLKRIALAQ